MESVTFLKFWKLAASPTTTNVILSGRQPDAVAEEGARREVEPEEVEEEEEDSFFDLELLSVSAVQARTIRDQSEERREIPTKLGDHIKLCSDHRRRDLQSCCEVSQTDSISKRKILPIEPSSKPQSPIQLLKSAPKLPVFIFKKQRPMGKRRTDEAEPAKEEPRALSSKLTRDNSTRRIGSILGKNSDEPADPSGAPPRRFSKETVHKYLKLIKPLYGKVLKKHADNASSTGDPSSPAADSPMREKHENSLPAGIRLVCKHLGKSKSASAASTGGVLAVPPANRRDDSLLQQHDGIQSAILHCKRSFNASTEHPLLFSRTEAAASQERPRSLSCKGGQEVYTIPPLSSPPLIL